MSLFDNDINLAKSNATANGLHLDVGVFSPKVQQIATSIASVYQSDLDAIITDMMVVGGVAAGKKIETDDSKYRNNLSLYACNVAKSGSNKSEPLKRILLPARRQNKRAFQIYAQQLEEWKSVPKNTEPRPQLCNQSLITDTTQEALISTLKNCDCGCLQYADELATIFGNLGRYNKDSGSTFYLSAFDKTDIIVNRKSDDSVLIQRPFLSILGTIQPDIIRSVFTEQMMQSGLLQRFIFTYQPEMNFAPYSENSLDPNITEKWCALIDSIYNMQQRTLYIRDSAKIVYVDFYNDLQQMKMSADSYMASVYSKLQIIAERVAGIIHLLNEEQSDIISSQTMTAAVGYMRYFARTAEMVAADALKSDGVILSKADLLKSVWANFKCTSQTDLANTLNISRQYLSKVLNKN